MISINVSGETLKECHEQIIKMAAELTPAPLKEEPVAVVEQPTEVVEPIAVAAPSETVDKPVETVDKPVRRRRRTKAEMEAASKTKGKPTETDVADVVTEPLPVAAEVVTEPLPVVEEVVDTTPPMPEVVESDSKAMSFRYFKQNIPGVVLNLMKTRPEFNEDYVKKLSAFAGGAGPWEWHLDEDKCKMIYDNFCNYGFITKQG